MALDIRGALYPTKSLSSAELNPMRKLRDAGESWRRNLHIDLRRQKLGIAALAKAAFAA